MNKIILDNYESITTTGHSSKGNQLKWKCGNNRYKADYMGYESLSEVLVSKLLRFSNIHNFIDYEVAYLEYKGTTYIGCKSKNFLQENEELITLQKLFRQYTGKNLVQELLNFSEPEDKIMFVIENVIRFTHLENFGKYLSVLFTIDTLFLNEDRHTNNIAFIYNTQTNHYRLCPYFDYGLSLFADTTTDFSLNVPLEQCYEKIEAKPFCRSFDEQLDTIEFLFGNHIRFHFSIKDVQKILDSFKGIYSGEILKRVEQIMRLQIRKYQYLFSTT